MNHMMYTTKEHNVGSGLNLKSVEDPSPSREGEGRIGQANPEVLPKKKRRYYTTKYKLRILDQVDKFSEQGQLGAFLRREGLYYSTISRWRKQREQGAFQGLSGKRGPKESKNKEEKKRIQELERENIRLKKQLQKAETIIDFQKKISEILEFPGIGSKA